MFGHGFGDAVLCEVSHRLLSVAREGPGDAVTLRIFLSVFNVHIQRAPCAGQVVKIQTVKGNVKMV